MNQEPNILRPKTLLEHFTSNKREDKKFCFILGAGASKQSGIPTGKELVKTWIDDLKKLFSEEEINTWLKERGFAGKDLAEFYPQIYEKRFDIDPQEGYYYLEKIMEGKEPSCGYSVLVQVLANTQNNVVVTTNFDSLTEDAMFMYTNKKPLVCGHEALTAFIKPVMTRPLIAKIHRDVLFAPKNQSKDTAGLDDGWKKSLTNIFKFYTPIVIGYGGNDGSLMGFLEQLESIEGGIFWCYRESDGLPNERIKKLVIKHKGYLVPIEGFDEMMLQLNNKLNYGLLDEKIKKIAEQRAEKYKSQIENIQRREKSQETTVALEDTIKKQPRGWWTIELLARAEKDIEKKGKIYESGIMEFPKSAELYGSYANFLYSVRKEYDKAEGYYKKALELDPNNATNTGNYANFLRNVRKEYDKAEEYYKKALELDPNNATNTGNYANFLRNVRKEYDRAEDYYKKALELDPNNANQMGNYAQFFLIKGDKEKGKEYINKAFTFNIDNKSLLVELWFYRYAHFPEWYEEGYKRLLELVKNGARSIGWNLKPNIEQAKKDGHPHIDLLYKFDKIITEDAPIDILDK